MIDTTDEADTTDKIVTIEKKGSSALRIMPPTEGRLLNPKFPEIVVRKTNDLSMSGLGVSMWATKVFDYAVAQYNRHGIRIVDVNIADIAEASGSKSSVPYTEAESISKELHNLTIQAYSKMGNARGFSRVTVVEESKYSDKSGILRIAFSTRGLDMLCNPKEELSNYTQYHFHDAHSIKSRSPAAALLFGLCATHAFKGEFTDKLEDLRIRLNVEEGKYMKWGNFNQRVLIPNINLINASGVFYISHAEGLKKDKKNPRTFSHVRIVIAQDNRFRYISGGSETKEERKVIPHVKDEPTEFIRHGEGGAIDVKTQIAELERRQDIIFDEAGLLAALKFVKTRAQAIEMSDADYVRENIDYCEIQMHKSGDKKGSGYFINALKNDYAAAERRKRLEENKVYETELANQRREANKAKISDDYKMYKEGLALKWVKKINSVKAKEILYLVVSNPQLKKIDQTRRKLAKVKTINQVFKQSLVGPQIYYTGLQELYKIMTELDLIPSMTQFGVDRKFNAEEMQLIREIENLT